MCVCELPPVEAPAIAREKALATAARGTSVWRELPRRILRSRPLPSPRDAERREDAAIVEEEADHDHHPSPEARSPLALSQALKTGTAESHEAAENVRFVHDFIQGKIDRDLYTELVTGLYHTYVTLERLLEEHAPAHFPSLHFPKELNRVEALKEDMEYWHGLGWEAKPECRIPSPAVKDYVERMEEAARMDPLLLLSHAYTRYLGDLSGGKVLARIARRALNLGKGRDGLQFYHFEHIKSAKLFKDVYREALDELVLDADRTGLVVAEANVAFALNMRVFEELDVRGGVPGARARDVGEALSYYDREVEFQRTRRDRSGSFASYASSVSSEGEQEAKCPFGFAGSQRTRMDRDSSFMSQGVEEDKCPFGFAGGRRDPGASFSSRKEEAKCPFGFAGGSRHGTRGKGGADARGGERCPWPFVFLHDPTTGTRDWQTWFVVGLSLCWFWSRWNIGDVNGSIGDAFAEGAMVQDTDQLNSIFGADKYGSLSDLDWFME